MTDSGDVFGVLRWGLKTYAWVVALFILLLGVLMPWLLRQVPDQYTAQAQVGPTEAIKLPNLDVMPRVGETVFNNGVVAQAVRESVSPPIEPTQSVIPQRVELIAAQDNIVYIVVGHGPTPRSAEHAANVAAARFAQELNKYDALVGSFAIQRLASPPLEPDEKIGGAMSIAIGVLAGLAAGVGTVALLLVWRRPVVDPAGVRETTGAPVLGKVFLGGSRRKTRGLPQLCRLVNSGATNVLLLAGPKSTRHARRQLGAELRSVLGWSRDIVWYDGHGEQARQVDQADPAHREHPPLVIIDDPTQAEVANRPASSLTLLVVREGIGHAALSREAELYLDGDAAGVVLVRGSWWGRPPTRRKPHLRQKAETAPRTWRADEGGLAGFAD
ncbi:MAG TPA: hypothetical protein VFZ64_10895 [Nocardioidaceae bacterium]